MGSSVRGNVKLAHSELPAHAVSEGLQPSFGLQTAFREARSLALPRASELGNETGNTLPKE